MCLPYNEHFDFATNVRELAGSLAAKVRELEDQRFRIMTNSQNHPEMRAYDVKSLDDRLEPLRLRARAAESGFIYYDPRDMSGGDAIRQTWVRKGRERGMLLRPDNWDVSLHAQQVKDATPLQVIRGGNGATDLGSPTMSVR